MSTSALPPLYQVCQGTARCSTAYDDEELLEAHWRKSARGYDAAALQGPGRDGPGAALGDDHGPRQSARSCRCTLEDRPWRRMRCVDHPDGGQGRTAASAYISAENSNRWSITRQHWIADAGKEKDMARTKEDNYRSAGCDPRWRPWTDVMHELHHAPMPSTVIMERALPRRARTV